MKKPLASVKAPAKKQVRVIPSTSVLKIAKAVRKNLVQSGVPTSEMDAFIRQMVQGKVPAAEAQRKLAAFRETAQQTMRDQLKSGTPAPK